MLMKKVAELGKRSRNVTKVVECLAKVTRVTRERERDDRIERRQKSNCTTNCSKWMPWLRMMSGRVKWMFTIRWRIPNQFFASSDSWIFVIQLLMVVIWIVVDGRGDRFDCGRVGPVDLNRVDCDRRVSPTRKTNKFGERQTKTNAFQSGTLWNVDQKWWKDWLAAG